MFTKMGDAAVLAKLGDAPAPPMHPVAWTLTALDAVTEAKIRALVKKVVA